MVSRNEAGLRGGAKRGVLDYRYQGMRVHREKEMGCFTWNTWEAWLLGRDVWTTKATRGVGGGRSV